MTETVDQKKCPFCAELINVEAKICRFCQKEIVSAGDTDKVNKNIEEWKNDERSLSDNAITCPHCSYEGKMGFVESTKKFPFLLRYSTYLYGILIMSSLIFFVADYDSPNSTEVLWGAIALFFASAITYSYILAIPLVIVFILRWFFENEYLKEIYECPNCNENCEL